jgi:cobalt/nickel transport system permease protein
LHHVVLERWSRGTSVLHRRDPRAKILATAGFLVVLATAHRDLPLFAAACFVLLCGAALAARLPLGAALARAAIVLTFTAAFAAISWASGDPAHALSLLLKSYISAFAVLLLVATTPIAGLLDGMARMGAPRFLLMVAQFLYRYLFVIAEEAQHMRAAAAARGGGRPGRQARLQAAGGAVAALFARSYRRAEDIHRAMLSRSFGGEFHSLEPHRAGAMDVLFGVGAIVTIVLVRAAIERAA